MSVHSYLTKACGLGSIFLFGVSGLLASDLVLQKVPPLTVQQAPAYPKNLARQRLGARVEVLATSENSQPKLFGEDPAIAYELAGGRTSLLVSFSSIQNVENISFLNNGAKGNIEVSTASAKLEPQSAQWHRVASQELTPNSVNIKVGPIEAKYVRLTFDVTDPGQLSALGVYSAPALSDFTMPVSNKALLSSKSQTFGLISYTDLHAKARAAFVSSGENLSAANNMIDDQPTTTYGFASSDAAPTTVIDLGKSVALRHISAIYATQKGTASFYVLQALPGTSTSATAASNLRISAATLANLKPVGVTTDDGSGRASVDFPTTTGRYIMMKWTPAAADESFSIAEIAAYGDSQSANLLASNAGGSGGELMESDGKTIADGKDAKDYKEMPAEGPEAPAEGPPPDLPPPPPFTFIPEIVPTSE